MNTSFIKFNTEFDFKKFSMEQTWKGLGAEGTFSEQNNLTKNHGFFVKLLNC